MNPKKKKIIISAFIAGGIILIVAIVLLLWIFTDLFKSPQSMFYKYLFKNIEIAEGVGVDQAISLDKKLRENSYKSNTNFILNLTPSGQESTQNNTIELITEGRSDAQSEKNYTDMILKFAGNDLFNLKYLRNKELYGLKSNEVTYKYLAVENKNLKQLAQNLGNDDVSSIPDQIEPIKFDELFNISKADQKALQKTYSKVLAEQLPKQKFTKQKGVALAVNSNQITADEYRLTLTEKELANLEIKILETMKNDNTSLNLIVSKASYLNKQGNFQTIEMTKEKIQNQINEISKKQYSDQEAITMIVYVSKGKTVRTEIQTAEMVATLDYNNSTSLFKLNLQMGYQDKSSDLVTLTKEKQTGSSKTNIAYTTTSSDNQKVETNFLIDNKGINTDLIETNVDMNIKMNNNTYTGTLTNKINFVSNIEIETLDENNSAKLNDLSKEQLDELFQSLGNRLGELFTQKLQLVLTSIMQQSSQGKLSQ